MRNDQLSQIKLDGAAPLSEQISVKRSMHTEKRILWQSYKLPSKKQTKRDIGWNCCIKRTIYPMQSTKNLILPVQASVLC